MTPPSSVTASDKAAKDAIAKIKYHAVDYEDRGIVSFFAPMFWEAFAVLEKAALESASTKNESLDALEAAIEKRQRERQKDTSDAIMQGNILTMNEAAELDTRDDEDDWFLKLITATKQGEPKEMRA